MKLAAVGQGDGRKMPYVVFLSKLHRAEAIRAWLHGAPVGNSPPADLGALDGDQMSQWFRRAMTAGTS